jgi:glycosyltransferase involved in cell wall biosynthesis
MDSTDDPQARGSHRRVVMLVDNGVDGDSRVQKSARSAAAAGWDVILLGRAKAGQPQTWKIGDAEVRLIPMATLLSKRRHEFRRRWLSAPLAYPPTGIAAQRRQAVKAWRVDLAVRREMARSGRNPGGALRTARLRGETLAAKITGKWVSLRSRQLTFGQRVRRRLIMPSDRVYTFFWRAVLGDRSWRRLEPILWDYELAYGPVIDALAPDLIHANDFRMLGVGARAASRARAKGRPTPLVWDAHEFLPGVEPWQNNARWLPGNTAHEREYAPYADAVITVSDGLAELLQEHHKLTQRPAVVLNAPDMDHATPEDAAPIANIREQSGIGPDVPLLVYSGLAAKKRGIDVMIEAMPLLPDAHVALVVQNVEAPFVVGLISRARALGAADRLHVFPYVPHWQVVPFLSAADVGVIPIRHFPNHEIALITKFFEYSHAKLPMVVSDVRTMASTVKTTGQGEVFRADDVADYARAITAVLADRQRYRAVYDRPEVLANWTWQAQADVLDAVYRRLIPDAPQGPEHEGVESGRETRREAAGVPS